MCKLSLIFLMLAPVLSYADRTVYAPHIHWSDWWAVQTWAPGKFINRCTRLYLTNVGNVDVTADITANSVSHEFGAMAGIGITVSLGSTSQTLNPAATDVSITSTNVNVPKGTTSAVYYCA